MLEEVKERLGIESDTRDAEIQGYIDDFTNKIKSVCNRSDLPEKLEYLCIKYAQNCTVFYKSGYGEGKKEVSSVSDNGQSVSFKELETVTKDDVDLDKIIIKNSHEIFQYAYMRW